MTSYRAYRLSRLLVWPAAVLYGAVALGATPPGQAELFPFFNWSLFTFSSSKRGDVVLIIRAIDGRELEKPTLFYDLKDRFAAARSRDPTVGKLLDRWSHALSSDDISAAEIARAVVENSFMGSARSVEYDLAVIHYDPVRRLRDGTIDSVHVISTFTKEAQ